MATTDLQVILKAKDLAEHTLRITSNCNRYPKKGNKYNLKHGKSHTRLYQIYNNMKSRCYKSYAKEYENYGGRGISICEEWLGENGFAHFYDWSMSNGYSEDLTIDRIDNDKNYSPDNCRWASRFIQNNNSRHVNFIELDGEVHSISEWSRIKNLNRNTIVKRLRLGWNVNDALNKPSKTRNK